MTYGSLPQGQQTTAIIIAITALDPHAFNKYSYEKENKVLDTP